MYRMEGLLDGTIDLEHVMLANDYLDVLDENERIYQRHLERSRER
jgi:hypothetical protein